MKVLIFGPRGYIGQKFLGVYPDAETSAADIADQKAVSAALDALQPDVVLNCAGKTGSPNVDWCEEHKEETLRANVEGPLVLAMECLQRNIYLMHMSTGCIYQGDNGGKGFTEEDAPNFFGSFYSRTKGAADQLLRDFPVLQLRIRMPFDNAPHPRNLITKLEKYPKINALPNSLTYLPDFLVAAQTLIEKRATGIYNVVNPGVISPYAIMELYREIVDSAKTPEPFIPKKNPEARSHERSDCMLSTEKLHAEGIALQPISTAVEKALHAYKSAYISASF